MADSDGAVVQSLSAQIMSEEAVEAEVSATKDSVDVDLKVETENGVAEVEEKVAVVNDSPAADTNKDDDDNEPKENGAEKTPANNTTRKKKSQDPPAEGSRSSKRSRKTAQAFQPENFAAPKDMITIIEGRGMKLEDIPNVKDKLESLGNNSNEIAAAHKFVFRANMGKEINKNRVEHLLQFSGYLPAGIEDEEERNKVDEKIETKYSQKAYHLKKAELKMLCDTFDVDRSPASIDKDELIERLCDFLSEPDPELTNANKSSKKSKSKKSKAKKKKASKKKEKEEEDETEDEEEEEEESDDDDEEEMEVAVEEGGEAIMPSDKALRKWVKAYVACFNADKVTIKHALQTASDKFGVDMKEKKSTLKTMLTEEI